MGNVDCKRSKIRSLRHGRLSRVGFVRKLIEKFEVSLYLIVPRFKNNNYLCDYYFYYFILTYLHRKL